MITVAFIDDDEDVLQTLQYVCEKTNLEVLFTALNYNSAFLKILHGSLPDVLFVDYFGIGGNISENGVSVIKLLYKHYPMIKTIMISAGSFSFRRQEIPYCCRGFLQKGEFDFEDLFNAALKVMHGGLYFPTLIHRDFLPVDPRES